jgi:ATP-dependent Lon protease
MNDTADTPDAVPPTPSQELIVARQVYPGRLPILPVPHRPFFPKMVMPFVFDTPALVDLITHVTSSAGGLLGVVLSREAAESTALGPPTTDSALHGVGTIAHVLKVQRDESSGRVSALLGGMDRFRVKQLATREPFTVAEVEYLYEVKAAPSDELKAHVLALVNSIKDLVQLNPLFKEELSLLIGQGITFEDPGRLADLAAFMTTAAGEELQEVLETLEVLPRLDRVLRLLNKELDISRLQAKIRQQIEERVTRQQREYLLREQLKAIKRELGLEKDDKEEEVARYLGRLEQLHPSDEARQRIDEELEKLRILERSSPEYNLTRNYLDWLTSLPWGVESQASVTLEEARDVLDEHHYGLGDVKARIVEFIAAGMLRGGYGGSIICLVGPPGVGKTSIGRSIARALGREFYRFSLGGMHDEAEIKGHRRTYIGAMPGKVLQALRVCKTANPLIMLDEIDKLAVGAQGDPASALLEALDPEQNRDFLDHYLDVRFDLSGVLFVCTANQLDTIPPPLLDRMEVIQLSGYLLEEKLEIARRFLIPREIESLKLGSGQLRFTTSALRALIDGYARDAGVRALEKQIKRIFRKVAVELVEDRTRSVRIGPESLVGYLGKRVFADELVFDRPRPGVVRGLAWTSMGGETLCVESTPVRTSSPGFKQTGQLGKVMVESSDIAYTFVRSLCAERGSCGGFFDDHFIHLHVPAGATPKDGPSAGVTMAASLYTLAHGKAIKPSFAMTGELTVTGQVMPVGGIREKIIAARRAKVKHVVMPLANQGDFETLPEHVKVGIQPHFVRNFAQIIELCLE